MLRDLEKARVRLGTIAYDLGFGPLERSIALQAGDAVLPYPQAPSQGMEASKRPGMTLRLAIAAALLGAACATGS
jgi:hypothetical protein